MVGLDDKIGKLEPFESVLLLLCVSSENKVFHTVYRGVLVALYKKGTLTYSNEEEKECFRR